MRDLNYRSAELLDSQKFLSKVLKFIILAAIITAPLYIIGERFDLSHLGRVLIVNGSTAIGAGALLLLVKRGHVRLISEFVVWSLLTLISFLAATNGEPIHTNVINFVLVLVLANMLLPGRSIMLVTITAAIAMSVIAYHQTVIANSPETNERFVETVVQFGPQFIFIAVLLRMVCGTEQRAESL